MVCCLLYLAVPRKGVGVGKERKVNNSKIIHKLFIVVPHFNCFAMEILMRGHNVDL